MEIIEKLRELHNKLHENGVKIWYLRDPIKKQPSVSLTMMVISFNFYLFTLVNKFGKWFSDVDGAAQLLLICAGLYFGRSFTGGKGKATLGESKEGDK
jgi:hypothetical protein